jgi:hypothetical protein
MVATREPTKSDNAEYIASKPAEDSDTWVGCKPHPNVDER